MSEEIVMTIEFVLLLFSLGVIGLSTTVTHLVPIKAPYRLTNRQPLLRCIGSAGGGRERG